ncbi:MAG: hypothetical protein CL846_06685 [Crocinitomicaceae bacterium]|nr:hypothetical protein [Crocinitomicaceae bacterium]|tara:strand:- start:2750 stop:4816 length:2067 start_codon:yes stop_codon:yes gene_type:complete
MIKLYRFLILIFLLSAIGHEIICQSQKEKYQNEIDSLSSSYKTAKSDIEKIEILQELVNLRILKDKTDLEIFYTNIQIETICNYNLNNKNLAKNKRKIFKKALSQSYRDRAIYQEDHGQNDKAYENYDKGFKIDKEIDDSSSLAKSYLNLGRIFYYDGSKSKAIQFNNKSLELKKHLNDSSGMANVLNNLGSIYSAQKDYETAKDFFYKSLRIREAINDTNGLSSSYSNIADVFFQKKEFKKSLEYHTKSLLISKKSNDLVNIANSKIYIGEVYFKMGDIKKAISSSTYALKIAKEKSLLDLIKNCSKNLHKYYKINGDILNALKMHELFSKTKDTLSKMSAKDKILSNDIKLKIQEYENKQRLSALENEKNLLLEKEKTRREKTLNIALFIITSSISIFLIIVFINYKKTKKQKSIISLQHVELDESHKELNLIHKEIKDSINYAKKIQDALLISKSYINKILPNSFVFYKPKDVVSGDFYWAHETNCGKIFFTVADCTGHGVPGAMVSMIGNALLNENIVEKKVYDTDVILENMRNKITTLLNEEGVENENKDGMHMALCCFDKQTMKLDYSGAFNPLIHITNNEINEIKANSQPIALYSGENKPFDKHTIKIKPNDSIFLYSDGFQDQFGGEKGKKYMSKRFKQFLLNIYNRSLEDQYFSIKSEFTNWKGNEEQVDDVCIMGLKF